MEYKVGDNVLCKRKYEYGFLSHNDVIYNTVFEEGNYYQITELTKYDIFLEAWKPFDVDVDKFYDYFCSKKEERKKKLEKLNDK